MNLVLLTVLVWKSVVMYWNREKVSTLGHWLWKWKEKAEPGRRGATTIRWRQVLYSSNPYSLYYIDIERTVLSTASLISPISFVDRSDSTGVSVWTREWPSPLSMVLLLRAPLHWDPLCMGACLGPLNSLINRFSVWMWQPLTEKVRRWTARLLLCCWCTLVHSCTM